jgi:hypothetical protein
MEPWKIENFGASHPGETFPRHRTLSGADAESLKNRLRVKLGLPCDSDDLQTAQNILSRQSRFSGPNAESEGFDLREVFATLAIVPSNDVYLYWGWDGTIDQIEFCGLATYFDDIWYPGPDDIGLFDETLKWIVLIDHGGFIGSVTLR